MNYDIDVPLALPVYGQRRVDDLRYIASQEAQGVKIDGQNVFSSGWAYGYWLSDIAAMRGAWDPQSEASSLDDAFAATLAPVAAAFGDVGDQVSACECVLTPLALNQRGSLCCTFRL